MSSFDAVCSVDVETFSDVDILNGAYAYTDSPAFQILLVSYSIDGGPVKSYMPRDFLQFIAAGQAHDLLTPGFFNPDFKGLDGQEEEFLSILADPHILKTAYNANFERTCFSKFYSYMARNCPPEEWQCTAVMASTLGLPRSLDNVGKVLGVSRGRQGLRSPLETRRGSLGTL